MATTDMLRYTRIPLNNGAGAIPAVGFGTLIPDQLATAQATRTALEVGFRHLDCAERYRNEAAVGEALTAGVMKRDELFLQTKFTFRDGQDHRLPYDPAAPVARQVEQSFASSLQHLHADAIDCYVLHGPSEYPGLGPDDWEAWRAMEAVYDTGKARLLGVSNVSLGQLRMFCERARVPPRVARREEPRPT